MALRNMREIGDEILYKRSKELKKVSRRDLHLIEDMLDTMYEREGVGLAAPQVGVLKRIVVIHGGVMQMDDSDQQSTGEGEEKATGEVSVAEEMEESVAADGPAKEEAMELPDADPIILINPVIIEEEGSQTGEEGCLSVPGKWGMVKRPEKVTVRAVDANMEPFELEGEGLLARVICHELDHLDGKLYVDLVEGELRDVEDREGDGESKKVN